MVLLMSFLLRRRTGTTAECVDLSKLLDQVKADQTASAVSHQEDLLSTFYFGTEISVANQLLIVCVV